jgi:hypothetical protein
MLDAVTVAKILGSTAAKVLDAARRVGTAGAIGPRGTRYFRSHEIDKIKDHLNK